MDSTQVSHREDAAFGAHLSVHKMPAHWLMARLGKRVLRPGGLRMTRWLLEHAGVVRSDDVIEFAPGLGLTAREILRRKPNSYAGVERDAEATEFARRALARAGFPGTRILYGDAAQVPLPDGSATVVLGEAMLSMQPPEKKRAIIAEAHRLLRAGGRFAMHELAVAPEDIDRTRLELIQSDLSKSILVGVRIGTVAEWEQWLEEVGFQVDSFTTAPMHLLEPGQLIHDEGVLGAARFVRNILRMPGAAKRLREVRDTFRTHQQHLCAVALVARRSPVKQE